MTSAAPPKPDDLPRAPRHAAEFDPDSFRMPVGEHLEELRSRLIRGIAGFILAFILCALFGGRVVAIFCAPLIDTLLEQGISPQLYFNELADPFMTYIKISLISGAALAAPWMVYQLWQFVAAGLYPSERKTVTRYVPLSLALLVSGMLFVYFFVLPITIEFFIKFPSTLPLDLPSSVVQEAPAAATQPAYQQIQALPGDPEHPKPYQWWFDTVQQRVKVFVPSSADGTKGDTRILPFGPQSLLAPLITLPQYIDMVVMMLLAFGLCFQLPLVQVALTRVGVVDIQMLRTARRYVYLMLAVLAAIITPDAGFGMIAMLIPLCLLYELGIVLSRR